MAFHLFSFSDCQLYFRANNNPERWHQECTWKKGNQCSAIVFSAGTSESTQITPETWYHGVSLQCLQCYTVLRHKAQEALHHIGIAKCVSSSCSPSLCIHSLASPSRRLGSTCSQCCIQSCRQCAILVTNYKVSNHRFRTGPLPRTSLIIFNLPDQSGITCRNICFAFLHAM